MHEATHCNKADILFIERFPKRPILLQEVLSMNRMSVVLLQAEDPTGCQGYRAPIDHTYSWQLVKCAVIIF